MHKSFRYRVLVCCLFGTFSLFLTKPGSAQAPQTKGVQPVGDNSANMPTGTTYAVVVGISDYKNPDITDLQFAHTDAAAFVRYLRSPAGGAVPESNITFLINENATAGQVAAAMDGLLEHCKPGDRAIIYFSGHGDVERKTLTQPGFLLCEDAPSSVYMGGGTFPLVFLQEIVSTLSVQNQATVIIFTDACRAGKLAGTNIGGAALTAANLAKISTGITKILSCQPNEFSLEGVEWGGGRGVFSFHLLHGLTGLADQNMDGIVTLREIERYLEDEVPPAVAPHNQMPLVDGPKSAPIAWVDSVSLARLKKALEEGREPSLAMIDSRSMDDALLAGRDSSALFQYRLFKKAVKAGNLLEPEDQSAYTLFLQLKDRAVMQPFQGLMRRNLAAAFQDEAQKAINDYLASDPEELRKRWGHDSRYERFPTYLEKAAEILGAEHYLYNVLKAREFYFRGLNLRLAGEQSKDTSRFIMAIDRQKDALQWDLNAAYAYNELGLLERRLENYKTAIRYFEKAIELSPQWALPWTNLSAVYIDDEEYDLAVTCGERAAQLNPANPLIQFNLGIAYSSLKPARVQDAINHYEKTLELDPGLTEAYFNLGLLYLNEAKKSTEAVRVWKKYSELVPNEAEIYQNLAVAYLDMGDPDACLAALHKALEVNPQYHEAQFNIAEFYLEQKSYAKVENELAKYQKRQPDDPRTYYLIARMQAEQNDLDSAMASLEKSFEMGFNDKTYLEQDVHMTIIRNHPAYPELVARYFPKN
ncbi:MAG: tetratricopeptide repeat protein [Saprospiraceae bacterium]